MMHDLCPKHLSPMPIAVHSRANRVTGLSGFVLTRKAKRGVDFVELSCQEKPYSSTGDARPLNARRNVDESGFELKGLLDPFCHCPNAEGL